MDFPGGFDFYHLGQVEALNSTSIDFEGKQAVAFQLYGDQEGLFVLLFAEGLDTSLYSELGNVLASRMSRMLSESSDTDLMISPPRLLNPLQVKKSLAPIIQNQSGNFRVQDYRLGTSAFQFIFVTSPTSRTSSDASASIPYSIELSPFEEPLA